MRRENNELNDYEVFNYACRDSLATFTAQAFSLVEPSIQYEHNWHIDCIAEHLQAVHTGEIRNLIINMPPRALKTHTTSVSFPAWVLGKDPSARFILTSFKSSLAEAMTRKTRQILRSEWYQQCFPMTRISDDMDRQYHFETTKMGQYYSSSMESVTGMGGDYVLVDDPLNPNEAASDVMRLHAIETIKGTLFSRFNDPRKGKFILNMQRLHDADPTGELLKETGFYHLKLPAEAMGRSYYYSVRGKSWELKQGDMLFPKRFTREVLDKAIERLGTYNYCTPKESPVLMADLSMKPIGEIKIDDKIIGFLPPTDKTRRKLCVSEVKKITRSIRPVFKITLDSGHIIRCTEDHKWFTGRGETDKTHKQYDVAKVGGKLMRVSSPEVPTLNDPEDIRMAGWLAGFFDADGSAVMQSNTSEHCHITFTQGTGRNIILCDKLEKILTHFGFTFKKSDRIRSDKKDQNDKSHYMRTYRLTGNAFDNNQKFLHMIGVTKWRQRFIDGAMCSRFIRSEEKVISIEPEGEEEVFGLTTTTGNYIVWGLASSNCGQYIQEPVPLGGQELKQEWVQYYAQGSIKPASMNICILVDPSGGEDMNKKKGKLSDWTAMAVIGLAPDNNYYLLDMVRDRLNPTDRIDTLFMLHRKWNGLTGKPPKVGYEKYGMMTDTHYIKEKQKKDAYHFPITELGGQMKKEERIRRLIPDLQNNRWYFPQSLLYVDVEGRSFDLVQEIIKTEMATFPRSRYDDMIDAISRIFDMDMVFPKPKLGMVENAVRRAKPTSSRGWKDF